MTIKNFARSLVILMAALLAPLGIAHADPNQGPGGPILVITDGNQNFGKFYAEILRTEGFNEFAVAELGSVSASTLNNYDVVVVAKVAVTSTQAAMLATWVDAGGNLVLMDPPSTLASLAGITQTGNTLANGYLLVNNGTRIGSAIVNETIQYHGTAQLSSLNGATSLASLYSSATAVTAFPAITLRSVGSNGGQVATFMYDLATSVVYTRQGNPAWATQERDGLVPRRSNDKFFGNAAGDPQPDWVNLAKVAIPQADEQQRFFANLITEMNADRKALPRFWYFPHGYKAAVIMTGDDHGTFYTGGATRERFTQFLNASPAGCSLDDWECVRGTSYLFTDNVFTNADAASFQAQGFELGLHVASMVSGDCVDYTLASLTQIYTEQQAAFFNKFTSVTPLKTMRHHCIGMSDWASAAKVQLANGIRLDTNYYYWPASWIQNVPGQFTGSAMPMRFADLDGSLIDVFQVVTQMTDESGQQFPYTPEVLLDRAVGASEQYGAYTVNAHIDVASEVESYGTIEAAKDRGVPIISARQLLTWLDARNDSSFSAISKVGTALNFTVTKAAAARGLRGMLPYRTATNQYLDTLRRSGADVPYEVSTVKGIEYAMFDADTGPYVASYVVDSTPPQIATRTPAAGATNVAISTPIRIGFSEALDASTVTSSTVELRTAANALVPSTISYVSASNAIVITPASLLSDSTGYSITVRGGASDPRIKDTAGNAFAATATWTFTTAVAPTCPCTIFSTSDVPAVTSESEHDGVELGVKFRADVNGYVKGIRFYKGTGNTGTHTGTLWSESGTAIATGTFVNESAEGWQQLLFSTPVAITGNTTYVVSYYAPNGGYAYTSGAFTNAGVDNGYLHALSSPSSGGNGVYTYGSTSRFPNSSWLAANYWVDVIFDRVGGSPTDSVPPTLTITSPVNASTYEATGPTLALGGSANDNLGVTEVTWSNDRGGSGTAGGTTSWNIASIALASGANTITVSARDFAGNTGTDTIVVNYSPAPDSTPPTVTARTPAAGATDVSLSSTVSVTFSEAMNVATMNTSTIELRNPANALIPATVSYNPTTFVATLTPSSALSTSTVYTVTVRGGATDPRAKDAANNPLAANSTSTFTTTSSNSTSIWPATAVPNVPSDSETQSVELGLKFRSDVAGFVTGVRFYKGPTNSGVHTGSLWSSTGQLMSTATFVNETATGWQQVLLPSPVAIAANTTYVVSYLSPNGGYAYDENAFATSGVDNGTLHALSSPAAGGNGVYAYGTGNIFPTGSFNANYWVDVLFATSVGPDVTPPSVATRSPASGAINVPTNAPVTVGFSENMNATTINTSTIELRNASNVLVPSTVTLSGTTATLVPNSVLANTATYTVTVRGGSTDPRVKDSANNALAANDSWSFTTAAAGGPCAANAITAENCLAGNPASEWDVSGAGDPSIQGFATQISVNRGSTVQFKVSTSASNYRFDIYRMGYYGGLGARKITTVNPTATLPQTQPSCLTQPASGLIDCGNWAVSGQWAVPANAVSGVYFAKLVRPDTGGSSHIMFIVRNDSSTSDVVFQTSDTTWQAYNTWGGNSLYVGSPGTNPGRAYKVSYNRPFNTRGNDGGQDWVFNAEYPMIRWLESNGYDVSYITGVDTDRTASLLSSHRLFLSVGHDEYWSGQQRTNVENARNAGLNLAFFSGNEVFWKTRWENSIDSSGTAYRTLVSYKETHANAKIDPLSVWTGTWRDPRFSPPADGGRPENALTGTAFTVNAGTSAIVIPAAEGKMRLWRGTSAASLTGTQTVVLPNGTLGYEWDSDVDNGSRPAGLFRMSDTTVNNVEKLLDYGSTYGSATSNHALTMYKHASGARVFGAGTVQWSWGLDANHDRSGTPISTIMQQATVNLFADMNVQPATLQAGLSTQSASTDVSAPTVTITSPASGANVPQVSMVISGTAADVGGQVAGVEVSTDGGTSWHPASGRASWTYTWAPDTVGAATIRVRAVDDSGNLNGTPTTVNVTIASAPCPCSLWPSTTPSISPDDDPGSIELGTRFRSSSAGRINALRFWKDPANTGTHVGSLWSSTGALLAQVTFTGETASGWQVQNLASPVTIAANTDYVVSYHTNAGRYTGEDNYFSSNSVSNGPLRAPQDGEGGTNGRYVYSSTSAFPTETYSSEGYYVDVVFDYASSDQTPPAVTITSPTSATTTTVSATPFSFGGTASDAVGVTQVTWANNRGGSGTASGTTAWSVSGAVLQSGANVITVTARDAAGNTSTDTLTVTYNAPDATAPVVTITSPTSSSTTTVSTTPLNLGGTASDAVGVTQVSWVNNRGGSGTASGTTAWSVTGVVLQTGSNVLTVTARDAAGNTSTDTLTVTYTPDTTSPAVTITSPTSNATLAVQVSTLNLGGSSSDAVGVTQVTWANNRGGSGTASGTTSWTASGIALQSGSNIITVSSRDAAGNVGTDSINVTYTPDSTAPAVTITSPTSNATLSVQLATLNLGGSSSDAVGVTQVTWANNRGGSGTASGTTSWTASGIALQSGSNIITVSSRDAAGNVGTDSINVTYTPDSTLPTVTITGPTSNATITVGTPTINLSGSASDNVGVTQVTWANSRGGSGTASGTTSWSVNNLALQTGSNVITVTARDAAGNVRTDTLTATFTDTTAPAVTITSPTSNSTLSVTTATLNLGGSASDTVGVTQVSWVNNRGGSGTASGTTSWTVSGIALQSGSNVLTVTARDAAGNTRTDTLTVTYTPDTTLPNISILTPTSGTTLTTSASSVTLGGTASDNIAVTLVSWTNSRGGSGNASGTTFWSSGSIALLTGSNLLTVTARDAAGNVRTDTLTVTRN